MPKSAAKTADKIPQPHGGALLPGGKKGNKGGGRTPDAFRQMCQELASSQDVATHVKKILANPEQYPGLYIGALKWASEHGYGKPKETIDVNVSKLGELSDAELEALAKKAGIA